MSKVALFVEFDIKPEHLEDFEKIIRGHAKKCFEGEEGCVAFHVMIPRDEQNRVYLYECYADQAAFDVHINSPVLKETRAAYEGMYNDRTLHICDQA